MASTYEATGLVMAAPGGFQQLAQKSWALPACAESEVRVHIEHVALNFADLLICEGTYQVRPEPPFSPGLEVAGRVVTSGHPLSGARVVGLLDHGGLATAANIHDRHLVKIPDDVSNQQAVCLPVGYGTSEAGLFTRARLMPGETVLIHGASSGVGKTAAELAQAAGCRLVLSASSQERKEMFQAQGFEHVFVIGEEFRGEVEAALGPRPIHVVYDAIGGAIAKPSLSLLAFGGRYLVIGFAAGEPPLFPANHLLVKNVDVVGFYWGAYVHHDPNQFGAVMTRLMEKVSASEIQPQYTELRGFSGAMEGLKLLKQRNAKGKIVVNLTENG